MGWFTKKSFSDRQREDWSAQLMSCVLAQRDDWGESPPSGYDWDSYAQYWAGHILPQYAGLYGGFFLSQAIDDGFPPVGWRDIFIEEGGYILLYEEAGEPPDGWKPGHVYWVAPTGLEDDDGEEIYGWQELGDSWKNVKDEIRDLRSAYDLENLTKSGWWKDFEDWAKVIAGILIVSILLVLILAPIIGGVAIGLALGETIALPALVGAIGTAFGASSNAFKLGLGAGTGLIHSGLDNLQIGQRDKVDVEWVSLGEDEADVSWEDEGHPQSDWVHDDDEERSSNALLPLLLGYGIYLII